MADAVGNLFVKLGLDMRGFLSGRKKFKRNMRGMAADAAKTGRMIKLAFAAVASGAVVGVMKKTIDLAREQIKQEAKLAQVLKATGGAAGFTAQQLKEYAAQLQTVTNFGDEVTLGATAIMATFRNVKGDEFKEAIALAQDMATTFDTDLSSSATQLGKALNDPITGLTALQRIGVTFSDTQKAQIKDFVKAGEAAKAQGVILAELRAQFGGVAIATADAGEQARNAFGDIGEKIGTGLMPVVDNAARSFNEWLGGVVDGADSAGRAMGRMGQVMDYLAKKKALTGTGWKLALLTAASQKAKATYEKTGSTRDWQDWQALRGRVKEQLALRQNITGSNIYDTLAQEQEIARTKARNATGGGTAAAKKEAAQVAARYTFGDPKASISGIAATYTGAAKEVWKQIQTAATPTESSRYARVYAAAYKHTEEASPRSPIGTIDGYRAGSQRAQQLLARLQAASINRGLAGMDPNLREAKRHTTLLESIEDKVPVLEVSKVPI